MSCAFRTTSNDTIMPINFQFMSSNWQKVQNFEKGMAKILMMRSTCSTNLYLSYAAPLSPQRAMSMCPSFYPVQFGAKPLSCSPIKPQFCVQVQAFSSQQSKGTFFFCNFCIVTQQNLIIVFAQTETDELPARVGFLGLGIMGSPMAQNLIKAG